MVKTSVRQVTVWYKTDFREYLFMKSKDRLLSDCTANIVKNKTDLRESEPFVLHKTDFSTKEHCVVQDVSQREPSLAQDGISLCERGSMVKRDISKSALYCSSARQICLEGYLRGSSNFFSKLVVYVATDL